MKPNFRSGIIYAISGTLFYGLVGVFVRKAEVGIGPVSQSFGRIFFAFIFIAIFLLLKRRPAIVLPRSQLRWLVLGALLGMTIQAMAFTQAISKTSIANAYFLLYSAPIFVVLFSYLFLKDRVTKAVLGVVFLSILGVALMFNPSDIYKNLGGNIFGCTTGITFASYLLIVKHKLGKTSPEVVTFWALGFGALGLLIASLILETGKASSITISSVGWTALAGGAVAFGTIFLNKGLSILAAWQSSVISLLEAVSALVFSLVIFSEVPPMSTFLGAILIVGSVILLSYEQKQNKWVE